MNKSKSPINIKNRTPVKSKLNKSTLMTPTKGPSNNTATKANTSTQQQTAAKKYPLTAKKWYLSLLYSSEYGENIKARESVWGQIVECDLVDSRYTILLISIIFWKMHLTICKRLGSLPFIIFFMLYFRANAYDLKIYLQKKLF